MKEYRDAYDRGVQARKDGWDVYSCPYMMQIREAYWLAGFDGYSYEEAVAKHKEAKEDKRRVPTKLGYSRIGLRNV